VRRFVVTARGRRSQGDSETSVVEADTAEHAVVRLASSRPEPEQPGVYESWPVDDPAASLRITLAARRQPGTA
jgi:hypothetical protein